MMAGWTSTWCMVRISVPWPGYSRLHVHDLLTNRATLVSAAVGYTRCEHGGEVRPLRARSLHGERDFFFRNDADGTFTEVAVNAGVSHLSAYYGFEAAWVDMGAGGWPD